MRVTAEKRYKYIEKQTLIKVILEKKRTYLKKQYAN